MGFLARGYYNEFRSHGSSKYLVLPPQKIRSWITLLPYHWKSPWFDQKIRINDFKTMLPRICQGHWLPKAGLNLVKEKHVLKIPCIYGEMFIDRSMTALVLTISCQ